MKPTPKSTRLFFIGLFLLGTLVRTVDMGRPGDDRFFESWRECDYASIARNYLREGMNIFYPRIDWRGEGPGYAEMEFPIIPWTTAALYKIFGYHEYLGRQLVYGISLLTLGAFIFLARYLLEDLGALIASLFFAVSPLVVRMANAFQPEGLMLFALLAAVYFYLRWINEERGIWYGLAVASTSLAVLAKINALHIGLLFLSLLLIRRGWSALRSFRVWLFPVLALSPALLWYGHAHRLWLRFGNSLGVSNETHWVGWDLFTEPAFILGLFRAEVVYVFMPLGIFTVLVVLISRRSDPAVRICFFWMLALFLYYIVTIRTTGDGWAVYYHVVSVPPVALLFGVGFELAVSRMRSAWLKTGAAALCLGLFIAALLTRFVPVPIYRRLFRLGTIALFIAGTLGILLFFAVRILGEKGARKSFPGLRDGVAFLVLISIFSSFYFAGRQTTGRFRTQSLGALHDCALKLKPHIPAGSLIIATGGRATDPTGYPVAYNAPYMFFWLDRKGFNIALEHHNIDRIEELIGRGASYFVLEKRAVEANPGFVTALGERYCLIEDCRDAALYNLQPGSRRPIFR